MNAHLADRKSVKKEFAILMKIDKGLSGRAATDEYYKDLEGLKPKLESFIRSPGAMSLLSTNQLLHLCRMVGSYRPMSLHSFLIYCANEVRLTDES